MGAKHRYLIQWLGWQLVDDRGKKRWSTQSGRSGQIFTVWAQGIESAKWAFAEMIRKRHGVDIRGQGATIRVARKPEPGSDVEPVWQRKVYS